MMTELFTEAIPSWKLTELYRDIAQIKGIPLTEWEKTCLRGLLCRCSPKMIAAQTYWTVGAVRTELSRRLYPFIAALTKQDRIVWHKIADDLAGLGYKNLEQLKTDLVKVSQSVVDRSKPIAISDIIATVGKLTFTSSKLATDPSAIYLAEQSIDRGHQYAKSGDHISALESYHLALTHSISVNINLLISIARCYDRLKQYSDSLAICYFALSFNNDPANPTPNHCKLYNFLGGVFHELAIAKQNPAYLSTALDYYDRAIANNLLDILPIWNQIDLILHFIRHDLFTRSIEQNLYLNTAIQKMNSLLEVTTKKGSSDRYHQQILADMELAVQGLDPFWQAQHQKFQQLTISSSN
jgi:tetratricopeptide (TPR) repeat protein